MKQYVCLNDEKMVELPNGPWIRYKDHCERVKELEEKVEDFRGLVNHYKEIIES